MRRSFASGLAALSLLAISTPLPAHHGTGGIYDMKKGVKVEGVVQKFLWRNPHSALFVEGSSETGEQGTFVVEMGAPAALLNDYGIEKKAFKPGDRVKITIHPSFTNTHSGQLMQNRFWVNDVEFHSKNQKE